MPTAIILMGVSGSGKTTVGERLSEALGWPFFDGDDYHPQANVDKMAQGIPLDDDDRQPWLEGLHGLIREHHKRERSLVLACSALKASYRDLLRGDLSSLILFVHLAGSFDLIHSRMQDRSGHFMRAEMLRSQFRDLETPGDALLVSIDQPVDAIVQEIISELELNPDD